jgi:hypothetical protein
MLIVLIAARTAMAQNQATPSSPQASKASARVIPAAVTIPPAPRPNDPPKPKQPGIHRS